MTTVEWVDIRERKPPRDGRYLVCCQASFPELPFLIVGWYLPSTGEWALIPTYWLTAITHWMEIPTLPGGHAAA